MKWLLLRDYAGAGADFGRAAVRTKDGRADDGSHHQDWR